MKTKERLILSILREKARVKKTEISKLTNIPLTTVHRTIRRMEKTYIKKYSSIVDFKALGYTTRVTLILKFRKINQKEWLDFINTQNCVNNVFRVYDDFDYVLDLLFRNSEEMIRFNKRIYRRFDVKKKHVLYIIGEGKRENFLVKNEQYQD